MNTGATLTSAFVKNIPFEILRDLAPVSMAWQGRSLGEICRQLKDPSRNGGLDMPALLRHMSEDTLVGWAWAPGGGRAPAPGTQASFGGVMRAWSETGAYCPPD